MNAEDVKAVLIQVVCGACKGKRKTPGGQREYGEVVNCWRCSGSGTEMKAISLDEFVKILKEKMG